MSESSNGADTLADTVTETHDVLSARLADAEACRPTRDLPRDRLRATDPFLASTSRHVCAANQVLGRAARHHLPHGRRRAQEPGPPEPAAGGCAVPDQGQACTARPSSYDGRGRRSGARSPAKPGRVPGAWSKHSWPTSRASLPPGERDRLAERLFRAEKGVGTRPHPLPPAPRAERAGGPPRRGARGPVLGHRGGPDGARAGAPAPLPRRSPGAVPAC
ncbi:hypothetical protein G5V59_15195 [Nocardioides sp. W3-2-3]|uniref:hypothetical protein n=1 Tax=Nocardioides convexus TaxID=2712224 RepID=UPI002418706D|nr:hypothetical protein [Nocardioides convexus]NHA00821.1 hypothetical protein [Nocardioides convexus]